VTPTSLFVQRTGATLLEFAPGVNKLFAARKSLADALRTHPKAGQFHLLNGSGSLHSLGLAKVGYDAAVKFAPGSFCSHCLAGAAALDAACP